MALVRLHALAVAFSAVVLVGSVLAFGPVHAEPQSSGSTTSAQPDNDDEDIEEIDDGASGAAEMKKIIAEELMPIIAKVVVADFKWRTDGPAACQDIKTARLAISAAETDAETLRKKLISENGNADVLKGFNGEMDKLKGLVGKLNTRVCGSTPKLSSTDKTIFVRATDMAEIYFARLSGAFNAMVRGDDPVTCQNLQLAKTSAKDIKTFLSTESQASPGIYREIHADDGVALLLQAEDVWDLSLDQCAE